jgi:excisionase family DNA binding protein
MDFRKTMVPLFVGTEEHAIPDLRILQYKYLLRPDEVANILRICQSKVYELCAEGVIEMVKVKRSVRIKSESVKKLIGIL